MSLFKSHIFANRCTDLINGKEEDTFIHCIYYLFIYFGLLQERCLVGYYRTYLNPNRRGWRGMQPLERTQVGPDSIDVARLHRTTLPGLLESLFLREAGSAILPFPSASLPLAVCPGCPAQTHLPTQTAPPTPLIRSPACCSSAFCSLTAHLNDLATDAVRMFP